MPSTTPTACSALQVSFMSAFFCQLLLGIAGDQVAEEPALPKAPVKVETSYAKIIENIEKKYLKVFSACSNHSFIIAQ